MSLIALPRSPLSRALIGFAAGAVSVLTIFQLMLFILGAVGMIPGTWFNITSIPPLGVPLYLNQAFWGGVWGIVFVFVVNRLPALPLALSGFVFALFGPILFGWTIVALLKGQPLFGGFVPQRMAVSLILNGSYGICLALITPIIARFLAPRLPA